MALSTRAHERKAVVDELTKHFEPLVCDKPNCEEPKHPQEELALFEKIADRLFKTVYEQMQARELWLLAHQETEGGPVLLTGWFAGEKDAEKAAGLAIGRAAVAVKVMPYQRLVDMQATDLAAFNELFGEIPCKDCGHQRWAHGAQRLERGKLVNAQTPASNRCAISCRCKAFSPPD